MLLLLILFLVSVFLIGNAVLSTKEKPATILLVPAGTGRSFYNYGNSEKHGVIENFSPMPQESNRRPGSISMKQMRETCKSMECGCSTIESETPEEYLRRTGHTLSDKDYKKNDAYCNNNYKLKMWALMDTQRLTESLISAHNFNLENEEAILAGKEKVKPYVGANIGFHVMYWPSRNQQQSFASFHQLLSGETVGPDIEKLAWVVPKWNGPKHPAIWTLRQTLPMRQGGVTTDSEYDQVRHHYDNVKPFMEAITDPDQDTPITDSFFNLINIPAATNTKAHKDSSDRMAQALSQTTNVAQFYFVGHDSRSETADGNVKGRGVESQGSYSCPDVARRGTSGVPERLIRGTCQYSTHVSKPGHPRPHDGDVSTGRWFRESGHYGMSKLQPARTGDSKGTIAQRAIGQKWITGGEVLSWQDTGMWSPRDGVLPVSVGKVPVKQLLGYPHVHVDGSEHRNTRLLNFYTKWKKTDGKPLDGDETVDLKNFYVFLEKYRRIDGGMISYSWSSQDVHGTPVTKDEAPRFYDHHAYEGAKCQRNLYNHQTGRGGDSDGRKKMDLPLAVPSKEQMEEWKPPTYNQESNDRPNLCSTIYGGFTKVKTTDDKICFKTKILISDGISMVRDDYHRTELLKPIYNETGGLDLPADELNESQKWQRGAKETQRADEEKRPPLPKCYFSSALAPPPKKKKKKGGGPVVIKTSDNLKYNKLIW